MPFCFYGDFDCSLLSLTSEGGSGGFAPRVQIAYTEISVQVPVLNLLENGSIIGGVGIIIRPA